MNIRSIEGFALSLATCALLALAAPATGQAPLQLVGYHDTPYHVQGVAVKDHLAFVAEGWRLEVVSIAQPSHPDSVGACLATPGTSVMDVAVSGNYAYVAGGSVDLLVIDVANPAHPWIAGSYDYGAPWDFGHRVAVANNVAMIADGEGGLMFIDVTQPTAPTFVAEYAPTTISGVSDVAIAGDVGYGAFSGDVQCFDVSGPSSVSRIGNYITWPDGAAWTVAAQGDIVCVAGEPFLYILDFSDPANPVLLGTYDPVIGSDVAMSGDLVFVVDDWTGMAVIDISNPASPSLVGRYDNGEQVLNLAAEGNLVFLGPDSPGLEILKSGQPVSLMTQCPDDIFIPSYSTVTTLSLVGFRITNTGTMRAAMSYQVSSEGPATLVDKGNPDALAGVTPLLDPGASYYPPEAALDIPPIRTYTTQRVDYVVEGYACETVVVFEPPVSVLIEDFTATATRDGVRLAWELSSDGEAAGVRIYRGSGKNGPLEDITPGKLLAPTVRSFVDGDVGPAREYGYMLSVVLTGGDEINSQRLALETPSMALGLEQNVPNPFNPTTTISCTLPEREHVTLRIYDVRGRLVAVLADRVVDAGRAEFLWDGRDSQGRPAGSGVYLYRLTAGGQTLAKKMVLLK